MPVITINGPLGAGAVSIGQMVAEQLEMNFYDRLIFTQAARLIGTPVGAVIAKEQRVDRFATGWAASCRPCWSGRLCQG
jgi:shikimate kinase